MERERHGDIRYAKQPNERVESGSSANSGATERENCGD